MSFAQRFVLVLLAAFFLSSVLTAIVAYFCASPLLRGRDISPREAGALALYRVMPALAALALTVCVLAPGYFAHEQRGELEGAGVALFALAAAGLVLCLMPVVRVTRALVRASALRRAWMAAAEPIDLPGAGMPAYALDLPFPLVGVLGILRPRLFISRGVLGACSPDEVAAIVEHERAHVMRRDNAVRLAMDAAPDLLCLTRVPSRLAAAWHRSVEQRADDAAARRLDLASALVKVARAAAGARPFELPASALYRGDDAATIDVRVRRLVDPGPDAVPARRALAVRTAAIAVGALLVSIGVTGAASRAAHAILEITVSRLP